MFLLVFGDNLENLIGHVKYAVFYLVCGFAAALAQIFMDPNSVIPMLGASGAISGVLGGYVVLFPTRKVRAIILARSTERRVIEKRKMTGDRQPQYTEFWAHAPIACPNQIRRYPATAKCLKGLFAAIIARVRPSKTFFRKIVGQTINVAVTR